jgi:transposase
LYDYQFSLARTPAELEQRHQAFIRTYNTTAHQGLLKDRRLPPIPVEVLGTAKGRLYTPEALGVSEGAVSQWMKRASDGGAEALRHRSPPGAPSRLTDEQRAHLPTLLQQGPEAYGFRGELWTRGRIAAVIRLTFGISYHLTHIGRLCKAIRWSPQKPARRARQRDEVAIARWQQETWPAIKKGRRHSSSTSSL